MTDKVVITCALTGVLTDPKQHPVPVTPDEMAREARAAFDAGAAVMHVHFRQQASGKGHLPSWEPGLAATIMQAIRAACPGVILNESTGTMGADISGPLACLRAVRPEIAACNAGSLNYLKVRADGSWAWPPHLFDNPVEKVKAYLDVMAETGTQPEFECFDVGIVRCVGMYAKNGMSKAGRNIISSWGWNPACRRIRTCCRSYRSLRSPVHRGRSPPSAGRRFGRCTGAPPSLADICAPASKTRSICRTAAKSIRTDNWWKCWRAMRVTPAAPSPAPPRRAASCNLRRLSIVKDSTRDRVKSEQFAAAL
jgi:hypothetical protein